MQKHEFITELKHSLQHSDFISLRSFYTPVVGRDAVSLYSLLFDYHTMNKGREAYVPFKDLAITLGIEESQLLIERKKLEAVGLIRTFEKANNTHFIILINKPLDAQSFRKNSLLYKHAISKIGELIFERVEFSSKSKEFSKDEFSEISTKYQDIFEFVNNNDQTSMTTLEIPVMSVKNKEEAINSLVPSQFYHFISKGRVTESQLNVIQQIKNLGFSSKSINLLIDYSFEVNGKLVASYIKKIAEDLFEKNVKGSEGVEAELKGAINSRKTSVNTYTPIDSQPTFDNDSTDSRTWEELFDSLGGGL